MRSFQRAVRKVGRMARAAWQGGARVRRLEGLGADQPRKRLLVVAWFDPSGLQTIVDHVALTAKYSRYGFDVVNLFESADLYGLRLPRAVSLDDYDGVVIHCTVSYNPENLFALDQGRASRLVDFRGVKVLMKQDEHFRIGRLLDYLEQSDFQVLTTCLPAAEWEKVYPRKRLPGLRLVQTLTGYVSDGLRSFGHRPLEGRPIDIGYRGSRQPVHFGRRCRDKERIGEVFLAVCRRLRLSADISSRWEDRFMGREWPEFLCRCKGTLGVESGASVFDFTGSLEAACGRYLATHPAATFDEVDAALLAPHEGLVDYAQIAPRHLEAAACRTAQILFEGRYSEVLVPWRHYLPLKRDLSNLDEVMAAFQDPGVRHEMVDAAYDEVVRPPTYHYAAFSGALDAQLDAAFESRGT